MNPSFIEPIIITESPLLTDCASCLSDAHTVFPEAVARIAPAVVVVSTLQRHTPDAIAVS
jgi:hypothetical protein